MAIRFMCPNGHRLKAADENAGCDMLCPVCQAPVSVPAAPPEVELDPAARAAAPPELPPPESGAMTETGSFWANDLGRTMSAGPPPLPRAELPGSAELPVLPALQEGPPWALAAGLLAVLAFTAAPAMRHLGDDPMAGWTRLVIGGAALQAAFVLWMLTVRHWAAVWIVAIIFAAASVAYGAITAFAFAAGPDRPLPWGMEPIRQRAAVWSATVLAVQILATYLCGSIAGRRRAEAEGGADW